MVMPGDSAESVVRRADRRMYLSKASGRNCVTVLPAPGESA